MGVFAKYVTNIEQTRWNIPGLGWLRWSILPTVMDLLSYKDVCSFIENNICSYFVKVDLLGFFAVQSLVAR